MSTMNDETNNADINNISIINDNNVVGAERPKGESTSPEEESSNIEKAIIFWKHPSMRDIPTDQKREYLHERGVSDAQIHAAWERILEEKDQILETTSTTTAKGKPATALSSLWPPQQQQQQPQHQQQPQQQQQQQQPNAANPYQQPQHQQPPYSNNPSHGYSNNQSAYNHPNSSPGSYDYRQPSSYGGMYPPEEEDGPMSFAQGSSLVALGGMLGLTAAAAARWLNGGQFQLLPPPANPSLTSEGRRMVLQETKHESNGDEDDEDDADDEEYIDAEEDEDEDYDDEGLVPAVQEKMLQEIESLSETMKSHVGVQEKLLQKLSNNNSNSTSITDSSMNLLRSSGSVKDKKENAELLQVWAQLVGIKAEMSSLHHAHAAAAHSNNGDRRTWEETLTNTLSHLESCMENVEDYLEISKEKPFIAKPVTSSSSTGTTITTAVHAAPTAPSTTKPPSIPAAETPSPKFLQPTRTTYTLRQSIRRLAEENEAIALRVGSQLLYLYIVNLSGNPDNPRYRKIFTCNESFQKVENLLGGKDLLFAVGFEEQTQTGCLEWLPNNNGSTSTEQEILAIAKLQEAANALSILKSGKKSNELTESALKALSPDPDVRLIPVPPPPPKDVPQTSTAGSCLLSPPQPTNTEFVPPSGSPTES